MNELVIDENKIENMIFEIRGQQVMLDSDLAKLYQVETKRINEAVKNNLDKFPDRFAWKLNDNESKKLLVEIFDQKNIETRGGKFKNPRVFTEQGVAMLATILKSKTATKVSIAIMDAFVEMRHYLNINKDIYKSLNNINNKLVEHDDKLELLFSKFNSKEKTFLPGKVYDAYREIINIFKDAKTELIIIDSYADSTLLDFIKDMNSKIILVTSSKAKLSNIEIEKFNKQYNKLNVIINNTFHDRYFILDRKIVYHCGASINYAGKKTFSINLLEDKMIRDNLLNYIFEIIAK